MPKQEEVAGGAFGKGFGLGCGLVVGVVLGAGIVVASCTGLLKGLVWVGSETVENIKHAHAFTRVEELRLEHEQAVQERTLAAKLVDAATDPAGARARLLEADERVTRLSRELNAAEDRLAAFDRENGQLSEDFRRRLHDQDRQKSLD